MSTEFGTRFSKPSARELATLFASALTLRTRVDEVSLNALIDASTVKRFVKGMHVTSRDDVKPVFLIVLEGRIRLFSNTASGMEFLAGFAGPGEIYGLRAILTDHASFDSIAEEDTVVMMVAADRMSAVLDDNPTLMRFAVEFLARRVGELTTRLEQLAVWKPAQHLAWRLLDLAQPVRANSSEATQTRLDISQDDLSYMIGKTRQTTNKLIKQLEADGYIKTNYRGIIILEPARLREFIDSDYPR